MLHSIFQLLNTEYVYVQVMCSLIEVSIQYVSKVLFTLFICMSKCTWVDCLCIRNSVKCKLVATLVDALDKANAALEAVLKKDATQPKIDAMNAVRAAADKLELEVSDDLWPMPKYSELLFVY